MSREEFEKWALTQFKDKKIPRIIHEDAACGGDYDNLHWQWRWEAWQAATKATIQRIQTAASEPVLLPGAIVLPGEFFSKGK